MRPIPTRGAALPGVLIVLLWVTGVTAWLVTHAVWTLSMERQEEGLRMVGEAADALAARAVPLLDQAPDWGVLVATAALTPCPGAVGGGVPAAIVAAETMRVQVATDAVSRWPVAQTPRWRPWLACDAGELLGGWRAASPPPWVLALIADDPDGLLLGGAPAQVVVAAVAGGPQGARALRIVSVRRGAVGWPPRIVAWRPG